MVVRAMQTCFRAHPEMYGSELEDDEDELEDEIRAQEAQKAQDNGESASLKSEAVETDSPAKSASPRIAPASSTPKAEKEIPADEEAAPIVTPKAAPKLPAHDTEEAVPKAAHDATSK